MHLSVYARECVLKHPIIQFNSSLIADIELFLLRLVNSQLPMKLSVTVPVRKTL